MDTDPRPPAAWLRPLSLLMMAAGLGLLFWLVFTLLTDGLPSEAADFTRTPTRLLRHTPLPTHPATARSPASAAGRAQAASATPTLTATAPPTASPTASPSETPTPTQPSPTPLPTTQPPPRAMEPFSVLPPAPIDWPPVQAGRSASKIGLHTLGPTDPAIMELIRRAKPAVVKAVDVFGWLAEVKQVSPQTVTVGRISVQDFGWVNTSDPRLAAQRYVAENLSQYQLNPGVDYWEGWNEFNVSGPEAMRWFTEFEAARACQMQALGFRAAVGGFSVGWPRTYADMGLFLPALEAAQACGGLFTLHEYNKPLLQCAVQTGGADLIPGAPALGVPAGPLTFRYRFWYEGYLKPRGLGALPLILSEYGIDAVTAPPCGPPAPNGNTWKDYADWWQQNGYGADGAQAYVNQLAWADREMRHDAYLIGAAVFTAGAVDAASGWNGYDLHEVLIPLAHYLAAQR